MSLLDADDDDENAADHGDMARKRYYNEWRACWITRGMSWWLSCAKPHDYDPVKQLARIGIVVPEGENKLWWLSPSPESKQP